MKAPLRLVVALEAEARPFKVHFNLARDPEDRGEFKIYRQGEVALVVSGPGKVAAAAATAYLHLAAGAEVDAVWLNVGIAGHGEREVGESVVAHKVSDRARGESWYPPWVFEPPCESVEVVTVDGVERAYGGDACYEMEASGFLSTAQRFASAELVHCLKIISDGPTTSPESLTAKRVSQLVEGSLPIFKKLLGPLRELSTELRELEADPPELAGLLARWHFTVSERRELRRLLRHWQALAPEEPLPEDDMAPLRRGKDVRRLLESWVAELPVLLR